MKLIKYLVTVFTLFFTLTVYAADNVLNVYNWSGYMPDSVLKQFERETGIKVNYSTYDSNETMYAKLKANPNIGYDIVVPSSYFVDRMRKQGMLQKIDKTKIEGMKNLNPVLLDKNYDPHNNYSIPYFWGSTGIVVNTQYFPKKDIQQWSDLWKPEYRDQLLILNDARDVFAIAFFVLGYSQDETNPERIQHAYLKIKELMPNVKIFNAEGVKSIYIDEDIVLGMAWSGDAYMAQQENPNIQFIYPKDGFIISIDSMVVPKHARHLDNAYKFINFILRPEIAKKLSLETGYPTPNLAALKLMPKEVLKNSIISPDQETLRRGVVQVDVGEANTVYEKYWELLKVGG